MDDKARLLEAFLFTKPGTLSWKEIAAFLEVTQSQAKDAALVVQSSRAGSGVIVLVGEDGATLATAPDLAGILAEAEIRERSVPLSKAQMETLALVLYHGNPTKIDVDEIRSVNSVHALRALLSRGMIAKTGEGRTVRYVVTPEAMAHLGLVGMTDAPEHESIHQQLVTATAPAEPQL
jgi:segregation and condensation protein B